MVAWYIQPNGTEKKIYVGPPNSVCADRGVSRAFKPGLTKAPHTRIAARRGVGAFVPKRLAWTWLVCWLGGSPAGVLGFDLGRTLRIH
jgi:hypothetical protein